ncbi:MAG: muramidase [Cyanobacteria bacterium SIG32]|nr:muramidase [Cyanobacteria bacterium SIG32]
MDFSTPTLDVIKHDLKNAQVVNSDQVLYNRIKGAGDSKEQLKKAAQEFEAIFITKMLSEMDKTVDREGGLFGDKTQYVDTFKSIVYQQMGHDIASNPRSSFGMAEQIYRQMEKYVK